MILYDTITSSSARLLVVVLVFLFLNTACGFRLAGSLSDHATLQDSYIADLNATPLVAEMKLQLARSKIVLAHSSDQARYTISLKNEHFRRSVLSVDPSTGLVQEYLLELDTNIDVFDHQTNMLLVKDLQMKISRDFVFDNAILARTNETETIKREMRSDMARKIIQRLQFLLARTE